MDALGFNGLFLPNTTEAALFRTVDRLMPLAVLDEVENISNRRQAETEHGYTSFLKSGYQNNTKVTRQNQLNIEHTDEFSVYSPKVICNVHGLEDILQDRSLFVRTTEAPSDSTIRGMQPDPDDPAWQPIRDQLYLALMFYHTEIQQLRDADLGGDAARLREKKLFKPLVDLAYWVDAHREGTHALDAIGQALEAQHALRKHNRSLTSEALLIAALWDLLEDEDQVVVHTHEIKERMEVLSTDDVLKWCSDTWIGKNMTKYGIFKNSGDKWRKQVTVIENKPGRLEQTVTKKLYHYRVRKKHMLAMEKVSGQDGQA